LGIRQRKKQIRGKAIQRHRQHWVSDREKNNQNKNKERKTQHRKLKR
jgi:hypothetical protein